MPTRDHRAQWRVEEERERATLPRVVVADDDYELRTLIASVLRRDGYAVTEVADGYELQKFLAARRLDRPDRPVDLVISDLRMPGRSGLDVLASLRSDDWGTPFILMTAFSNANMQNEANRLGAAAVFSKPFELDDLRTIACNLVE